MPAKSNDKAITTTQEEIEARFWKLIPAVNAGDERAAKALHD